MRAGIPAVPTVIKDFSALPQAKAYVRKPIDGLSCEGSFIFSDLQLAEEGDGIVQPLIEGHALSLSAVFSQGRSWLLSCNQQQITVVDSSFKLQGCRVNIPIAQPRHYEDLLQAIAQAFPGLWGYIGIDFMESERYGIQILEINPRLTTSYAGLYQATGIRMLAQLLRLFTGQDVDFQAKWNKTTHISITGVCQSCTTM